MLVRDATGTGGSGVALAIGKLTGRTVYKVETSDVSSKYIGETEKNLTALFEKAAKNDWILLFDEADALLGKRTDVKSSHDRYANIESSYLLQAIERHRGIVVLTTNLRSNIDSATLRRFNTIVKFPPD